MKPDELFYTYDQAVQILENKKDGSGKSLYYAKLLKDAPDEFH